MGNKEAKFKGPGKVLGTGEVVQPKKSSIFGTGAAPAPKAAKPVASVAQAVKKPQPASKVLTEAEREEKRKAAAAAFEAREKAWNERISQHRVKREEQERKTNPDTRAWNEVSQKPDLPLPDAETIRKQKEAAAKLENSGFNPFQATMASSTAARAVLSNINEGSSTGSGIAQSLPLSRDISVNIEEMQAARKRLQDAMKGSDTKALVSALAEAQKYDVPEADEARDLLLVLTEDLYPDSEEADELNGDFDEVVLAVSAFASSVENSEKKAASCAVLQTLLTNLVDHPENPKFRKIRLENKAIRDKILDSAQGTCVPVLESVGFTRCRDEEGQECLMVPHPDTLPVEVVAHARKACGVALRALKALKF